MNVNIQFSKAAVDYIHTMIEKDHGVGFRLSVKKTGCSGYAYLPTIVTSIQTADVEITLEQGVKVFVDSAWLELLNNLRVDYVEEDKLGLKQKRLVFINPKEGNRCGCGESFQIKSEGEE